MDNDKKPHIVAVMVSHNDLNERALASLQEATRASSLDIQVVIVDNASVAYDANALVKRHIPTAITILRDGDYGYGSSCNRGAKEVDAEYVFILNPDVEFADLQIFDKLYAFMKEVPQTGIVAPKITHMDGKLQDTCRRFPSWFMPVVQRTRLKHGARGKRYAQHFLMQDYGHEETRMVDWVQGSAMFLKKDLWDELGGFDDRFWMYFEDTDLCRRAWGMGRPVYYHPEAVLKHGWGQASAKEKSHIKNVLTNKVTRAHIASWVKYVLKWGVHDRI